VLRRILLTVALGVVAARSGAQEHVHSRTASEKLGTVHFATSCNAAAQGQFDRAVALLHSFEFAEAIKGFRSVLAVDPSCAMAYWGIALSQWSNPMAAGNRSPDLLMRGRLSVDSALEKSSRATERERLYIAAVSQLYENSERANQEARVIAYEKAMNELVVRQPADTEAKIFHAISLVASASPSDKTYSQQKKAGAILESLWKKQPNHPGLAHYLIHTYDYPALAAQGARAARQYAEIAPSAAHALHMPSHIFTRTGLWRESIETNLRSMDAALATASIAEALHAGDYAVYAYLQMKNDSAAKAIVDRLPALAARFDPNAITGAAPGSAGVFALAAIPARFALEREAWNEAASLEPKPSAFPWTDAMTWFARALGAAHTRNFALAHAAVDSLASIESRLAQSQEPYWAEQVAIQHLAALAWLDLAEGRRDSALARMRAAVSREDATEKSAVTPGPLAPARELLADMLMQLNMPAEALAEYRKTLLKEPNRRRAIAGAARAAALSGGAPKRSLLP
jgi:hypothetical protein